MIDLSSITAQCREYRLSKRIKQKTIANETGYSAKTISAFEHGKINNALILLWYVMDGFPIEYIRKEDISNGKTKGTHINRFNHSANIKNDSF